MSDILSAISASFLTVLSFVVLARGYRHLLIFYWFVDTPVNQHFAKLIGSEGLALLLNKCDRQALAIS